MILSLDDRTNDFVEVFAKVERNRAFYRRFDAARYGRAAAVNVNRDFVFVAVFHDVFDLFGRRGIQYEVGHVFNDTFAKAHKVDHRLTVCNAKPCVIVVRAVARHKCEKRLVFFN